MQFPDLMPFRPEMVMIILVLMLLILDLFIKRKEYIAFFTIVGTIIAFLLVFDSVGVTFGGMFNSDLYSSFFKMVFFINLLLAVPISINYLKKNNVFHGEYYALLVFATIGMMLMVSAGNLVVLYLGLELMALSVYVLTAFIRKNTISTEAAIKYFLLGAFSSAILLYGIALLYGITGSLDLKVIGQYIAKNGVFGDKLLLMAIAFFITAFGFKVAAVPFHMWTPDVYQGAPTSVTAFMSIGPKAAGFAVLGRVFMVVFPTVASSWVVLLIPIAILTMAVGNILALVQTNIKRMLAYSSIAHAGYAMLGIITANAEGLSSMMNYMLVYAFMNMGAFIVVIILNNQTQTGDNIYDYEGLNKISPLLSFLMLVVMFSLAGIPLTAGFIGKLYIFMAVVNAGFVWLAVVAVVFSTISAYYYLRIVVFMFMKPCKEGSTKKVSLATINGVVLIMAVIMVLLIGIKPQTFIELARVALVV